MDFSLLFKPQMTFTVGSNPRGIALGDLNQDSLPNIVTSNTGDNTIPIGFQGTGKASAPTSSGAYMQIGEQRSQADHAVQNRTLKGDGYIYWLSRATIRILAISILTKTK